MIQAGHTIRTSTPPSLRCWQNKNRLVPAVRHGQQRGDRRERVSRACEGGQQRVSDVSRQLRQGSARLRRVSCDSALCCDHWETEHLGRGGVVSYSASKSDGNLSIIIAFCFGARNASILANTHRNSLASRKDRD